MKLASFSDGWFFVDGGAKVRRQRDAICGRTVQPSTEVLIFHLLAMVRLSTTPTTPKSMNFLEKIVAGLASKIQGADAGGERVVGMSGLSSSSKKKNDKIYYVIIIFALTAFLSASGDGYDDIETKVTRPKYHSEDADPSHCRQSQWTRRRRAVATNNRRTE